jgi:hypothetical protein
LLKVITTHAFHQALNNPFADSYLQGNATLPLQTPDNSTDETYLATLIGEAVDFVEITGGNLLTGVTDQLLWTKFVSKRNHGECDNHGALWVVVDGRDHT